MHISIKLFKRMIREEREQVTINRLSRSLLKEKILLFQLSESSAYLNLHILCSERSMFLWFMCCKGLVIS